MVQDLKIPSLVPRRTIVLGCLFAAIGAGSGEWIGFYLGNFLVAEFPICKSSGALECFFPNMMVEFLATIIGLLLGGVLTLLVLSKLENIEGSFFFAILGGVLGGVISILLLYFLSRFIQPINADQFWIASSWILLPPLLTGVGVSLGFHRGAVVRQ